MRDLFLLMLLAGLATAATIKEEEEKSKVAPHGRVGVFSVIRFPNDACSGDGGSNGTCYTKDECEERGGTRIGSCAQDYGVCCSFSGGCGTSFRENNTYFESTDLPTISDTPVSCSFEVCKCQPDVCQLRLDFVSFTISGPSTDTTQTLNILNGDVVAAANGLAATTSTQCLTDTFVVTNPGGQGSNTICGENTGEHMYIDASEACNDMVFQLGNEGVGTAIATRRWNIRVTQYSCDHPNLAPPGCTQYFFGADTGEVKTFNFDGGHHLAGQNQNICVRTENQNCQICWTATAAADFAVSGPTGLGMQVSNGASCCGYGTDGMGVNGFDCAVIPGARKNTANLTPLGSQQCGRDASLGTAAVTTNTGASICSTRMPFSLRFLSDQFELGTEVTAGQATNAGFRLTYVQSTNNC